MKGLIVAFVLTVQCAAETNLPPQEPSFNGKTFTQWMDVIEPRKSSSDAGVIFEWGMNHVAPLVLRYARTNADGTIDQKGTKEAISRACSFPRKVSRAEFLDKHKTKSYEDLNVEVTAQIRSLVLSELKTNSSQQVRINAINMLGTTATGATTDEILRAISRLRKDADPLIRETANVRWSEVTNNLASIPRVWPNN